MRFSDRIGKTTPKQTIQLDSMDPDLRNSLWNLFYVEIAEQMKITESFNQTFYASNWEVFAKSIWISFFKEPIDNMSMGKDPFIQNIRHRFFDWSYLNVYNFLDFIVSIDSPLDIQSFTETANKVLERELSGYRFIDNILSPITNPLEIKAIEEALINTNSGKLLGANTHLREALKKMSDKTNPDFRNSIKESISAVESICKIIVGSNNSDLAKALKKLNTKVHLHPGLIQGFLNIYGYTSDSDGIRHAMLSESNLDIEDAQFMLITCSTFTNYLIIKANKSAIHFE